MNRKSFLWNMLGSSVYAAATILFTMIAKRVGGVEEGESFYMAFTTGQMLLTLGYFEIRPFQSTDVNMQYKAEDYFGFRLLTSALMLLGAFAVCGIYKLFDKAGTLGLVLIVLLTAYKMFDALSDVMEGEFQRRERMDLSGKSMFLRVSLALLVFILTEYLTKNLILSTVLMLLAALLAFLLFDGNWMRKMEPIRISFSRIRELFGSTILLFLGSAMCMWIWNGTKYVVEWTMDPASTLIYGIVFMPTMVINLGSGFLFKPMLTSLTRDYTEGNRGSFVKKIFQLNLATIGMTLVAMVGAFLLGVPVLSFIYKEDLTPYRGLLLLLLAGGGLNSMGILFYYALTVMRRTVLIFAGYIAVMIASIPLPILLTSKWGLTGAALSYIILMLLQLLIHGGMTLWGLLRKE